MDTSHDVLGSRGLLCYVSVVLGEVVGVSGFRVAGDLAHAARERVVHAVEVVLVRLDVMEQDHLVQVPGIPEPRHALHADRREIGVQQVYGVAEQENMGFYPVPVVGVLAHARVDDSREHVPLVALVGVGRVDVLDDRLVEDDVLDVGERPLLGALHLGVSDDVPAHLPRCALLGVGRAVLELVVLALILVLRELLICRDQLIEVSLLHAVALVERAAHLDETLAALDRRVERVGAQAVRLALVGRADDHSDIRVVAERLLPVVVYAVVQVYHSASFPSSSM